MPLVSYGDIPYYHAHRKDRRAVALSYPDRDITWSELADNVCRRARLLRAAGVRQGDFVTIALPNCAEFHEFAFAIWKLGAVPNVVSCKLPEAELQAIIDLANPRIVIGAVRVSGAAVIPGSEEIAAIDSSEFAAETPPYQQAMTSGGSTGRPKVIVDHTPAFFDPERPVIGMACDSVIINCGPLYHNAPFTMCSRALCVGSKVVGTVRFDAVDTLRLIEKHRVEWVNFVPTMMHRIWSLPEKVRLSFDISSLKVVWHMAAPMPQWLKHNWIEWLGADKIFEFYGGTERQGGTMISGEEWLRKPGSVGRPIAGAEIGIFDESGSRLGPDQVGEIYFLPQADAGPIYHYIGATPRRLPDGWESLGDMGSVDEDGYLYIADRRTDMIVRGGANIYPAEVEAALEFHRDVASCAVIGLPNDEYGAVVHAIVELKPGASEDAGSLQQHLSTTITKYKLPESYEFSKAPLRDDAGKVRRSGLRADRLDWIKEGRAFRLYPFAR